MTMITPSYLGETIEYSSLHACRSTLEDPTSFSLLEVLAGRLGKPHGQYQDRNATLFFGWQPDEVRQMNRRHGALLPTKIPVGSANRSRTTSVVF